MKKRSIVIEWLCSYMIILMIPVVTIFVNYFWNKQVIQNEIYEANNLILNNLGEEIDRYLNREVSFYTCLMKDKTFWKVIGSRKKDASFYYNVEELRRIINIYDPDISALIYLKGLDYVIGNEVASDTKGMHSGMDILFSDTMEYDVWLELLSEEYKSRFLFQRGLCYGTSEVCLVYANSMEEYRGGEPFSLFVSIPVSVLEGLTETMSDGARLLVRVGEEDVLVLSNQGVEAETEGLTFSRSGEMQTETGAYMEIYKSSGISGAEYCLLIPEDVFWRQLRQSRSVLWVSVAATLLIGLFCVTAVLRRNFQPIDTLVRKVTGGERSRENEYKMIEDAWAKLTGEKNSMYRNIITQKESLQGSYLLAMMKGRSIEATEDVVQLEAGQKMALAGFLVPLMDEKQFLQDEVVLFAVDNIFSELMEGEAFYRIEDGQYLFYLFMVQEEESEWKKQFLKSAEYLSEFIQERMEVPVCGAVSSMIEKPEELRFIYRDVMDGLKSVALFKKSSIVDMGAGEEGGKGIVQSIVEYVEEHFEDSNLNITTIAEGIGKNPKYISRIFREETQESILDYVNRLRIRKAQILIRSGEFTLEQISGMVGYASSRTFRRVFLKETGMNPGNYQENLPL